MLFLIVSIFVFVVVLVFVSEFVFDLPFLSPNQWQEGIGSCEEFDKGADANSLTSKTAPVEKKTRPFIRQPMIISQKLILGKTNFIRYFSSNPCVILHKFR